MLFLMGPITATRFFEPVADTEMTGIRIRPERCPALSGVGAGEIRDELPRAPRAGWTDSLRLRLSRSTDAVQVAALLSEALVAWRQPDPANGTALIAHRALERLRCLAAPAADTGYDDQAHMIHEFRALSGLTPVELLAERAAQAAQ